jgi:hypothetical protein
MMGVRGAEEPTLQPWVAPEAPRRSRAIAKRTAGSE